MRTRRNPRSGQAAIRRIGTVILAALGMGSQGGCTREFYREWANQDVSEAIFEKSRDPRWRLDAFSIEPPALSRFADPYDPDAPPAPPDDVATEALSPVPQRPSNRLITPAEGTGYWELMEYWRRQEIAADAAAGRPPLGGAPRHPAVNGLPENLGAGGFPTSLSTDPASRPGIPFEAFPGMADPYEPGGVVEPGEAIDADQPPGASALPIDREPGGGSEGGNEEIIPGYAPPGANTVAPGAGGPPPLPPTRPVPGASPPATPGPTMPPAGTPTGPGASAGAVRGRAGAPVIPVVRLQDGPDSRTAPRNVPNLPNSGTEPAASTPISVAAGTKNGARPYIPPPRPPAIRGGSPITGPRGGKDRDRMVARVNMQEAPAGGQPPAGTRAPAPTPGTPPRPTTPGSIQPGTSEAPPGSIVQPSSPEAAPGSTAPVEATLPPQMTPPGGGQPVRRPGTLEPEVPDQPGIPGVPPLDRAEIDRIGRMSPAEAVGLAGILVPRVEPMNESEAAGLPKDYKPYKLNMQQAFVIALINARVYQYQLEQLYLAALPVTLQRFAFEPQFYAGLSPVTGVPQTGGAGGSGGAIGGGSFAPATGLSTANSWTYATRFAPTGQVSTMNIGTVAGMGKLFNTGGQLLLGFASELVFNFAGKKAPYQPTVLSSLPMSFVQPLLRGGGRAVILEPLTNEERALLYQVRAFTQFRQQFFVVTLTGGTITNPGQTFALAGFSSGGNIDPTVGFIPAAFNVVQVEIDRRNVAFYANLVRLYSELIQGESSGLSQLQVDQVQSSLIGARQRLFSDKITYRNGLDNFKQQLGIPTDFPLILDQTFLGVPFYKVFDAVDEWQRNPNRNLGELPGIIGKIPQLQDIDIDGRSALGLYRNYRASQGSNFVAEDEDGLEDLLQAAVRIALEYRLDLMNDRAQLYDAWRQIRIAANTLKGVLNLTLTNNVYTGPYSTNPFAFFSQAKNFNLVIQSELPLVRVSERNNFRSALISYQRARRSLMEAEDFIKNQLRSDLRSIHTAYVTYEISKRNYELNVRLKDQAFEQIVAPPSGGGGGLAQSANATAQTSNLLGFQSGAFGSQTQLILGYENYQQQRLIFYRDIGTLPYDEWEAFRELFPTQYAGPIFGHAEAGAGPARGAEAPAPAGFGG